MTKKEERLMDLIIKQMDLLLEDGELTKEYIKNL